jgi:drug/metabolite transporter (DMT)-like permease
MRLLLFLPIAAAPRGGLGYSAGMLDPSQRRGTAPAVALLATVVFLWGFNWPVMKLALAEAPALWFSAARMAVAALSLFALQAALGAIRLPRRADLAVLASTGILQIALQNACINLALQRVPAGRSSVLAYATPLWVLPGAALFLGERVTGRRLIGLALGLAGLLLLFNPASLDWSDRRALDGNALLLAASLATAVPILHIRRHRWHSSAFEMAPWQCGLAAIVLVPMALLGEGRPEVAWHPMLGLAFLYAALPCSAFGMWAMTRFSRELPAMTTALGLLGVPVVGVLSSALALGEPVTLPLIGAQLLIAAGVAVGTPARAG